MPHLINYNSDIEDTAATIAKSKSKIDAKKEGIKRNLLSSYTTDEKDINK